MMNEVGTLGATARLLLDSLPCSVTLPAGAGKTELIAASCRDLADHGKRALVLTHTNAGVDAISKRLRKFDVPRRAATVRTIDAWCFDLISSFPQMSGIEVPEEPDWKQSASYHLAAATVSGSSAVKRMLHCSYDVLFVDEYQDCLLNQHRVVLAISESLPTAVLGDPLQCLFRFGSNSPVDWQTDVLTHFADLPVPIEPWRWKGANDQLGDWLLSIRPALLAGHDIDLAGAPVSWYASAPDKQVVACYQALGESGSVVALGRFRQDCVKIASKLSGRMSVTEAIDEKMLVQLCRIIDDRDACMTAFALTEFAVDCASGVAAQLPKDRRQALRAGRKLGTRNPDLIHAYALLNDLLIDPSPANASQALKAIASWEGVHIHCREAWRDVNRAVQYATGDDGLSVEQALGKIRQNARAIGRSSSERTVSRPLLAKGLEYEHSVVIDADQYSSQELYVALTRAKRTLRVLSSSQTLRPRLAI
jgi:hypothetical protein